MNRQQVRPTRHRHIPKQLRHGAAIVFSLIALLVASLMISALIRMTGLAHRQMVNEELRMQANLIADSACERGLVRLQKDANFQEETWLIPASQLGNDREARVQISVTINPTEPGKKSLSVIAEYPLKHPHLVRVRRQIPAS